MSQSLDKRSDIPYLYFTSTMKAAVIPLLVCLACAIISPADADPHYLRQVSHDSHAPSPPLSSNADVV